MMKPSLLLSPYLIIICFVIILLLQPCSTLETDPIFQYCDEAANRDPNFTRDFCVATFKAHPEAQTIATLEDLAAVSINLATSNATSIGSLVKSLLDKKDIGEYTKVALEDCYELYSDATSRMGDVKEDFRARDYVKANFDTSATMDAATTCEDGFKEGQQGVVSPLTKENTCFFQLTAIVLTFMAMLG